jgi:hypothetical protein
MAARWANPGAFILHLDGFELPSDTRYTPNSPVSAMEKGTQLASKNLKYVSIITTIKHYIFTNL